jgi:Domain of unknown function (DUF4388)
MEMGMAKATTSRGKGNSSGRAGTQGARVRSTPSPGNPATPVVFGSARAILRGELDKIGLSTLLTILEMERRTGILVLQRRRQLGRLHVRDGQIIRARIEGQGRQSGAEAVYQMLAWQGEAGQFELWQAEVEGADEIRQRIAYLLMEGMRRMDEAQSGTMSPSMSRALAPQPAPHTASDPDFQVAF